MSQKKISTAKTIIFSFALFAISCKKNIVEKSIDKNSAKEF